MTQKQPLTFTTGEAVGVHGSGEIFVRLVKFSPHVFPQTSDISRATSIPDGCSPVMNLAQPVHLVVGLQNFFPGVGSRWTRKSLDSAGQEGFCILASGAMKFPPLSMPVDCTSFPSPVQGMGGCRKWMCCRKCLQMSLFSPCLF